MRETTWPAMNSRKSRWRSALNVWRHHGGGFNFQDTVLNRKGVPGKGRPHFSGGILLSGRGVEVAFGEFGLRRKRLAPVEPRFFGMALRLERVAEVQQSFRE